MKRRIVAARDVIFVEENVNMDIPTNAHIDDKSISDLISIPVDPVQNEMNSNIQVESENEGIRELSEESFERCLDQTVRENKNSEEE